MFVRNVSFIKKERNKKIWKKCQNDTTKKGKKNVPQTHQKHKNDHMLYSAYAQHFRVDDRFNLYTIVHIFTHPHPLQNWS